MIVEGLATATGFFFSQSFDKPFDGGLPFVVYMNHVPGNHVILIWVFSVSQNRIRSVTPKICAKKL